MDLTEAEDIKKRWQEYTEELYKKDLHDPDNHDGVITDLEPDILECEVKWCREPVYCILSAALSTASSFRIWNSSIRILSLLGASVRHSARGKSHEEGGSAYAKAGLSLRSPPGNSRASTPKTRVCLLSALCFHLHL